MVSAAGIGKVVERTAGEGDKAGGDVDAAEADHVFEAAEKVWAKAEAYIQHNEVSGNGNARAVRRGQFDADGLTVGHECAIAQSNENAGKDHEASSCRNTQEQQTNAKGNIAGIHYEILAFTVEHHACEGADGGDDDGIDDKEDRSGITETQLGGVGAKKGEHARVADTHEEGNQRDGEDSWFNKIIDAKSADLGDFFIGELYLRYFQEHRSQQTEQQDRNADIDNDSKAEILLHQHAEQRADTSSQTQAQRVVVNPLALTLDRNDTGNDRSCGSSSNTVADTIQQANDIKTGRGVKREIKDGRHQIEPNAFV